MKFNGKICHLQASAQSAHKRSNSSIFIKKAPSEYLLGSVHPEVNGVDLSNRLRVGVAHGNAAHVNATLDHKEAVHAPVRAPRVLDEPVVEAAGRVVSVADGQHGVVHIHGCVAANGARVDARGVRAEVIGDLEGDRDWLLEDGRLQFSFITFGDVRGVAD